MNSQFMPSQQYRGPPQNFPNSGPPTGQPGFQNVPLDPQNPGQQLTQQSGQPNIPPGNLPPTSINNGAPPTGNIGQFPPNMGPPAGLRQIPSSQLPPGDQRPPSRPQPNQFPPPINKPGEHGNNVIPTELQQFPNGLNGVPFQNGPGFANPTNLQGLLN